MKVDVDELPSTIDLFFLDGPSLPDDVIEAYYTYKALVRPGGIIVIDDVNQPSIREVWDTVIIHDADVRVLGLYGPISHDADCSPTQGVLQVRSCHHDSECGSS